MKRLIAMCVALGLFCGLALSVAPSAEAKTVIKIAGMKPEGEPETVGMHKFGEYLEKLSNGKYEVKVYPNSQLGKEDSYIDQTKRGTIQMCATGTQMSKFHPAMAMLETPMLYEDLDHAHRAMKGDTFKLITDGFTEKSGMRTMNVFPLGFRHFYTKNPVKSIDDIKGLKMRVPNFAYGVGAVGEEVIDQSFTEHANLGGSLDVSLREHFALGNAALADVEILRVDALGLRRVVVVAVDPLAGGRDHGRDFVDKRSLINDGVVVGGFESLHVVAALAHAAATLGSGHDHYHVAAHFGNLGFDGVFRALANREHGNDGTNADNNAKHGQEATHLVVSESLDGYFREI